MVEPLPVIGLRNRGRVKNSPLCLQAWRALTSFVSVPLKLWEAQVSGKLLYQSNHKSGFVLWLHRSPGGHSHGREQSSSPRSTSPLEQTSSLSLLNTI